ncbi:hypothetical protein RV02_GL002006 [Enterococcus gilvus]|nr:hypothetical protein RV02_GL002006 [Enterococcus gilvus]
MQEIKLDLILIHIFEYTSPKTEEGFHLLIIPLFLLFQKQFKEA